VAPPVKRRRVYRADLGGCSGRSVPPCARRRGGEQRRRVVSGCESCAWVVRRCSPGWRRKVASSPGKFLRRLNNPAAAGFAPRTIRRRGASTPETTGTPRFDLHSPGSPQRTLVGRQPRSSAYPERSYKAPDPRNGRADRCGGPFKATQPFPQTPRSHLGRPAKILLAAVSFRGQMGMNRIEGGRGLRPRTGCAMRFIPSQLALPVRLNQRPECACWKSHDRCRASLQETPLE
jgi:hypothetical protein